MSEFQKKKIMLEDKIKYDYLRKKTIKDLPVKVKKKPSFLFTNFSF